MGTSGAAPTPILTEGEPESTQALIYPGMRHAFRRTPHSLYSGPPIAATEGILAGIRSTAYYRLLISPPVARRNWPKLVENLTVNETSFFRHKAQLDLFQKHVLEELFKQKQFTPGVFGFGLERRMFHRAEAYTLGMLVVDALAYYYLRNPLPTTSVAETAGTSAVEGGSAGERHQLLGTTCRAGRTYSDHQMAMVDYSYRLRYFDKVGERYANQESTEGNGALRLS